jgi:uncharacterized membrane protein YgcG
MFSPGAVDKANETLRAVERESGFQVVIESVESLGGQTAKDEARANLRALKLRGLYVLLAKKEHKVEVEPSDHAQKTFPPQENQNLVKLFVDAFKANDFDRGLLDAVTEIDRRATPAPGVRDHAKMFSSDAIRKADDSLRAIRKSSRMSVVIETVDSLNGKPAKDVAKEHASAMNLHGLYILISKGDRHNEILPSRSAENVFTKQRVAELNNALSAGFRARDFDRGLLSAVDEIRKDAGPTSAVADKPSSLMPEPTRTSVPPVAVVTPEPKRAAESNKESLPAPVRTVPLPPAPGNAPQEAPEEKKAMSFLPVLIVGGLGVLFLIWLVSKAFKGSRQPVGPPQTNWQNPPGGPQSYAPQPPRPVPPQGGYGPGPGYGPPAGGYPGGGYGPPPPQGGGGGFMSGLLGGAAGAVAGNILYDQFGRPHQAPQGSFPGPSHGAPAPPYHDPGSPGQPPQETYNSDAGAGGDWGSDEPAGTPQGDAGASGDWGSNETEPNVDVDAGGGGDWGGDGGADQDQGGDAGAGGDWGGNDPSGGDQGGGGDW